MLTWGLSSLLRGGLSLYLRWYISVFRFTVENLIPFVTFFDQKTKSLCMGVECPLLWSLNFFSINQHASLWTWFRHMRWASTWENLSFLLAAIKERWPKIFCDGVLVLKNPPRFADLFELTQTILTTYQVIPFLSSSDSYRLQGDVLCADWWKGAFVMLAAAPALLAYDRWFSFLCLITNSCVSVWNSHH